MNGTDNYEVFEYCTYRSEKESRHYYNVSTEDFDSIREKLKPVSGIPKRVIRVSLQ